MIPLILFYLFHELILGKMGRFLISVRDCLIATQILLSSGLLTQKAKLNNKNSECWTYDSLFISNKYRFPLLLSSNLTEEDLAVKSISLRFVLYTRTSIL